MTPAETRAMLAASCRICLLAPAMKDCKRCACNVGLVTVLDLDYPAAMYDARRARYVLDVKCRKMEQDFAQAEASVDNLTRLIYGEPPASIADSVAAEIAADVEWLGNRDSSDALPKRGLQVTVTAEFAKRWTNNPQHYREYYHTDNIQID